MQSLRPEDEGISRKHFCRLAALAVLTAGCTTGTSGGGGTRAGRVVNAGPAGRYTAEGVYAQFVAAGFFLVRRQGRLTALSSICTHRHCELTAEPDRTFYCDCHGSTFDPAGHVTKGPARRDLPELPLTLSPGGDVLVTV